jgi:hypothetical protein
LRSRPVVRIEDSFGNLITSDNSTVVTASRNGGSGTLQGNEPAAAAWLCDLCQSLAQRSYDAYRIDFAGAESSRGDFRDHVAVSPAAADHLVIQSQPSATATAGVVFGQQPVVRVEDSVRQFA